MIYLLVKEKSPDKMNKELNEREKNILRYIIQQFILTASPVGSRNITRRYDLGISPATVRNIMSDLEESGYIDHPHTSAGRIPTDKGYRFYVDSLMDIPKLRSSDRELVNKTFDVENVEAGELLRLASALLSRITKQLACVTYPKLETGIFDRLQIFPVTSTRILVVISIKSGFVKTITLELSSDIRPGLMETLQNLLNERLSGLSLKEIQKTYKERFSDIEEDQKSVVRLFIESIDKIVKDTRKPEKMVITGAANVLKHPEFDDPDKFQSVIELIEDKDVIIHILEKSIENDQVFISIGSENKSEKLTEYSFVTKDYKIGDVTGSLGIIGPKRMEYSKAIAIVDYVTKMLSEILKNELIKKGEFI
jgi:heat-inducible transcriptional repressor